METPNSEVAAGRKAAQQMSCMEVWGGSQLTTRGVEIGGLNPWVYTKPSPAAHPGAGVTARNRPLGIVDMTEYEQFEVELRSGDCVLSYTDALIESRDADGEMLGEAGLLRIVRHIGDVEPQMMTRTLLREIKDRYPEN